MFQIDVSRDLDSLLADAENWDSLAGGVPFRETAWLGPWWRHFGGDKQPHALVARDEAGQLRGLLPLYRTNATTEGRTLAMIGDEDACSDHVSVLARQEDAEEIAEAMGRFLASTASDGDLGWDLIDIDGVVEGDTAMASLAQELKTGGATLHAHSRMHTWFKPADASWDEHLKHYAKTPRRKLRRMAEKVGDGGIVEKEVAQSEQQVDTLLTSLIEMHQKRWTDVGQPGSYANPRFREFILDTAKEFLRRDRLYLNMLRHEGKDIGSELSFVGGNRILYLYSAGCDMSVAELEPGRLTCTDTLLQLYRADLAGIDFMRGDEEYKKRLSTSSRRVLRIRAVAPTWLPRLRHAAWWTSFELKQWVRRRTGREPITVMDITAK